MRGAIIAALFTAAVGVSSCAVYDDYAHGRAYAYHGHRYGEFRYEGDRFGGWSRAPDQLAGDGAALLDPWLVQTDEGRTVVTAGFDRERSGRVSPEIAHRANAWFRRFADSDRDLRLTDQEIGLALVRAASRRT